MSKMDDYLCGAGTLELIPEADVPIVTLPEEPEETSAPTDLKDNDKPYDTKNDKQSFLSGIIKGMLEGATTLWNGMLDSFKVG